MTKAEREYFEARDRALHARNVAGANAWQVYWDTWTGKADRDEFAREEYRTAIADADRVYETALRAADAERKEAEKNG